MSLLRNRHGIIFDRKMARVGLRTIEIRIGQNGVFAVTPDVREPQDDNYDIMKNKDPGMMIDIPRVNTMYVAEIPFESMEAACLLEGITVEKALLNGEGVFYYVKNPKETQWTAYQLGVETHKNNSRYVLFLELPQF
jgi:hypothetical protein